MLWLEVNSFVLEAPYYNLLVLLITRFQKQAIERISGELLDLDKQLIYK